MYLLTRRDALRTFGILSAASLLPSCGALATNAAKEGDYSISGFVMPEEGGAHKATWMAYGATAEAWGTSGNFGASRKIARLDLLRIAANLSRFEPVKMLVNNSRDLKEAESLFAQVKQELNAGDNRRYTATNVFSNGKALPAIEAGGSVEFIVCPLNDLWVRDTAPIFVKNAQGEIAAVDFNFNGWGQEDTGAAGWNKDEQKAENGIDDQRVDEDQKVAQFIINRTGVKAIDTWLVMEGGGIEVNGEGTAICTESCILNDNRNPNRSKAEIEAELDRVLGVKKVIWLKGRKAQDITDGHIDFYARFIDDHTVAYAVETNKGSSDYAVTKENQALLSQATTADGKRLKLVPLYAPNFDEVEENVSARQWKDGKSKFNDESFAAGYIGYYVTDKCVLMAQFGDEKADLAAFETLSKLYPNHRIMQIATDGLANGGGTIHCATQQQI